jgi:bacteriorhodopsin
MTSYSIETNSSPNVINANANTQSKPVEYYVKASFMITYVLLLTTTLITFIEAMRTNIPQARHVLNLETSISIVAGYFYSVFVAQIEGFSKENKPINWSDINKTRYIDWSITTPIMLLVLCIVLGSNVGKKVDLHTITPIVILNFIMLYIGYLGETSVLNLNTACFLGFIPFIAMYYIIFKNYVAPKYSLANYVLYNIFLFVWILYGIVYLLNDEYKNIALNILDSIAKCLVGLGLWGYFSRIVAV